ncbi:hypothetical protein [Amnibacterium sp.]|uniref:hypothetical protein n=1 Tax=Amnibacterium sp. TaxID=1872496 RepID=UPI002633A07F|nr:hypothetical protein [Amnibacterium sp.]MCU1473165.1 hypothetical protein [Amnibacterium sp.]
MLGDGRNTALLAVPAAATLLGLLVVVARHRLLPAKFFYDSIHIQQIAVTGRDPFQDTSFENAAYLFRILGLQQNELLAGLLSFALGAWAVWLAIHRARYRMTLPAALASAVALGLAAVYLGTYSKDVFVVPVVFVVLLAGPTLRGWLWVALGLLAYAHLFRSYWYIVLALVLVFALAARFLGRRRTVLVGPVVALVLIGIGTWLVLHAGADFARAQVNAGRQGSVDAATLIPQYLAIAQPFSGILDALLVLVTIIVPVPLLLKATPYYVGAGVVVALVWGVFFSALLRRRNLAVSTIRAGWVVLALLTTQALFEPDYGSVVRHLTPVLALVVAVALDRGRPVDLPAGDVSAEGAPRRGRPSRRSRRAPIG